MKEGLVIWLCGLSGAGKSTIAAALRQRFEQAGLPVEHLDGDVFRRTFGSELGFSKADRMTNIRRAETLANLLAGHGIHVIASFITPYEAMRAHIRSRTRRLLEVYVECPIEVCAARDPKGLYRLNQAGDLNRFTGIDDPFEPPRQPNVALRTDKMSLEACTDRLVEAIRLLGLPIA